MGIKEILRGGAAGGEGGAGGVPRPRTTPTDLRTARAPAPPSEQFAQAHQSYVQLEQRCAAAEELADQRERQLYQVIAERDRLAHEAGQERDRADQTYDRLVETDTVLRMGREVMITQINLFDNALRKLLTFTRQHEQQGQGDQKRGGAGGEQQEQRPDDQQERREPAPGDGGERDIPSFLPKGPGGG